MVWHNEGDASLTAKSSNAAVPRGKGTTKRKTSDHPTLISLTTQMKQIESSKDKLQLTQEEIVV